MKYIIFSIYFGASIFLCLYCNGQNLDETNSQKTRSFIKNNWLSTVRVNIKDSGNLIGLPKPYTVPSPGDMFEEMYYWDTYFTNAGLIIDGQLEQAKNNVEDIAYLVNRFGYMPNGNRTYYLGNSQPAYLSLMVRDIYDHTKDKEWLKSVLPAIEREYNFWMDKRMTSCGLNRYSNQATQEKKLNMLVYIGERLGKKFDTTEFKSDSLKTRIGSNFISECESGWDFNPRYESRCEDYCPLDLNCNLYMYEKNFAFFYKALGIASDSTWLSLAIKRKELINKYMYNQRDNLFYDYDYINNKLSPVLAASIMNLLWSGIATKGQAEKIKKSITRLEFKYGIAACEPGNRKYTYQWDYPNGWANLQFITIKGLEKYGYREDARRVAAKYVNTIGKIFRQSNKLYEKYNVVDGTLNVSSEYGTPTMMGWTAGVFVYADEFIKRRH